MSNADASELARFDQIAAQWWDPHGPMAALHHINPVRLRYINQRTGGLKGLRVLDIGCGGGLVSEPMARLGAEVTGVDASEDNIKTALTHAGEAGLTIDYRAGTAEGLLEDGTEPFDLVLNLEVVEHVADPAGFLRDTAALVKPGGLMICSTINRNAKSFAMAIVGAEYVMRWLPKGTHDWQKFITPEELFKLIEGAGLDPVDRKGFVFNPIAWSWRVSDRDLSVNYVTASVKR